MPPAVFSFFQLAINTIGTLFGDGIDDRPDQRVTGDENTGENQNGHQLVFKPAVDQVDQNIGKVQCCAVDQHGGKQAQPFDLIQDGTAGNNKSK